MTNPFADQAIRLTQFWADTFSRMAGAGPNTTTRPDQAPFDLARQMRDALFGAMSGQTDQYLRSPEFLETMRQALDASMTVRRQVNDLLTQLLHGAQGVARADVDAVLKSVHRMETHTLDRLHEIARQLDDVARRLDALERRGNRAGGSRARPPSNGRASPGKPARRSAAKPIKQRSKR